MSFAEKFGFHSINLLAFDALAQKIARSPSRRGKYLNLIKIPDTFSKFFTNSKTVIGFSDPMFRISNLSIFLWF
jgi:hypothetical protein